MAEDALKDKTKKALNISLDFRLLSIVLAVIIIVMLGLWRPWSSEPNASSRTITVTGESTIKSAPDTFVFSPTYETTSLDKATASDELIKKTETVVDGLKKLGVTGNKIKTDASGYSNSFIDDTTGLYHYSSMIQVTIDSADKDLTQKVQDYIVSTVPTGPITPYGSFSEDLRKQLESQGRDAATKDARAKADQSAKNLGFTVGGVKSVNDGSTAGGIRPLEGGDNYAADKSMAVSSLEVQPGEDSLSYTVTVVYYVE